MPAAPVAAALPLEETDLCAVEATEPGLCESFNDPRGIWWMVYVCVHVYIHQGNVPMFVLGGSTARLYWFVKNFMRDACHPSLFNPRDMFHVS